MEKMLPIILHWTLTNILVLKYKLEQYPTFQQLAFSVIVCAVENGNLILNDDQNDSGIISSLLDLGCGRGILGISCGLADAANLAILLDYDDDFLELARKSIHSLPR